MGLTIFSLLLSAVFLTSPVTAAIHHHESVKTLGWPGRPFYLVRLDTPSIPFHRSRRSDQYVDPVSETSIVLTISLSRDNTTLLVQDQAFLPFPSIPPSLSAPQIPTGEYPTWNSIRGLRDLLYFTTPSFSYDRLVHPIDESRHYSNHVPTITLDILDFDFRDHFDNPNGTIFHHDMAQPLVKIMLRDHNSVGSSLKRRSPNFEILDVWTEAREPGDSNPPLRREECSISIYDWKCADYDHTPYFRTIWRDQFDESGRIGSLHHVFMGVLGWFSIFTHWIWISVALVSMAWVSLIALCFAPWLFHKLGIHKLCRDCSERGLKLGEQEQRLLGQSFDKKHDIPGLEVLVEEVKSGNREKVELLVDVETESPLSPLPVANRDEL
ncbi:hypothetical protein B7494_g8526 [Chlorociboria aeruginascens]|nr:hypothetical protein B7494_g8526 [Chlorociboria aeruginascens]